MIDVDPSLPYFNLEVASTPNCNMACTYCFEGEELKSKSKQTLENLDLIIEKMDILLKDQKFFNEYRGICLNFWGGEPTINFEWNARLIEKIRAKVWEPFVTFFIYSNGYDFKKVQKHIDLFSEKEIQEDKIRIQISWDGIPGERLDHKGLQTVNKVETNIKNIALLYPNLNLKLKATIQPLELLYLKDIWTKFYLLDEYIQKNTQVTKFKVSFSPTLNYIDDFTTTEEYLNDLKESFAKIAKLELDYFTKHRRHLFSWFEGWMEEDFLAKRKTNCSAGVNIMALDVEGNASVCHGTLYSPLKKDFIAYHNINLKSNPEDFSKRFFTTRQELKTQVNRFDPSCQDCTATVCYKCPIVNVEESLEGKKIAQDREENDTSTLLSNYNITKSFQDRDPRHCQIYKLFGLFDRSLFNLKKRNKLI